MDPFLKYHHRGSRVKNKVEKPNKIQNQKREETTPKIKPSKKKEK